jgi:D-alanyl-D-alanine dipeptidase
MKTVRIISVTAMLLIFLVSCKNVESSKYRNPYNLDLITGIAEYERSVADNPDNELIDLDGYIEDLVLDIRYATANNFSGRIIYNLPKAYARKPVAKALIEVQSDLAGRGLGIKILDAYRPYSATLKFYEVYPDTNYVAAPWRGSRHNRGCAIDLTLIYLNSGEELEMPTLFDDFSETAHPDYENLPENVKANRRILIDVMLANGFSQYEYEWWHYDFQGWENFELMDLDFEDLAN